MAEPDAELAMEKNCAGNGKTTPTYVLYIHSSKP